MTMRREMPNLTVNITQGHLKRVKFRTEGELKREEAKLYAEVVTL